MRWNSVKKTCQWHVFRNSPDRACEGGVGLRRRRSRNPVHSTIEILQVRKRACFLFSKDRSDERPFCCRCARAGRALRCLPFRSSGSTGGHVVKLPHLLSTFLTFWRFAALRNSCCWQMPSKHFSLRINAHKATISCWLSSPACFFFSLLTPVIKCLVGL